jgi:glucose/arabinose dehydrogenase
MARLSRTLFVVSLLAAASCGGGDGQAPPSSPPPAGSGETVTGRERFGWTQTAGAADASVLQYAAYVDGARRVLEGATCAAGSAGNLECSAPLPPMSAGRHTLELAAFLVSGDSVIEGPKSAALQLTVASVTAANAPPALSGGSIPGSDGEEIIADILSGDLLDPADVAVDPAGRSFVVERAGRIRILDQDGSNSDRDFEDDLSSPRDEGAVVLSIALAPDFEQSHQFYVLKAEPGTGEWRALIVRYREARGRLGQAAVIASATVAGDDPRGVVRFGPDGALYVGVGSPSTGDETSRASSDGGRILRLLPDGRTPRDNPSASPVYSSGHRDPIGFAWHKARRAFLEVEGGVDADEVNAVRAGADYGWPTVSALDRSSSAVAPLVVLPAGTNPSGMTVVNDPESRLDGALIVSSIGLEDLLRIDLAVDGEPLTREPIRLLNGRFGAIGQVTAGPDGALYVVTRNRDTWGAGKDALVRLTAPTR